MSYYKELDMEERELLGDEAIDGPADENEEYVRDDDYDGQPSEWQEWQDLPWGGDDDFHSNCCEEY
jgi:hypothetical protein